ncbi:MAG TPA: sigma-70 family RNA polymerase sigma factor [Blastocatellia bacterium]|nr:sigma-70 family RNA polymerase sigma factor [Blastocatellia bacterium]
MVDSPPYEITQLLQAWRDGDEEALAHLIPLVEDELRRLAKRYMSRERRDHTLQTTALINEAYQRLIPQRDRDWQNRAHFIGVAARVMRQVLIEYSRQHRAGKRGGGARMSLIELDGLAQPPEMALVDVLALDEALTRLSAKHWRPGRVVEMRFFGGLTEEEIAEALSINRATVGRDWRFARAWLYRELEQGGDQ